MENAIITSTGQYIVAWDFKKVKKGQLDKYEIKKYVILCVILLLDPYASPFILGMKTWSYKTISNLVTTKKS